jgi:hypothetical protein
MTPETLWAVFSKLSNLAPGFGPLEIGPMLDELVGCADAWAASETDLATLRARLEEAVGLLRGWLDCMWIMHPDDRGPGIDGSLDDLTRKWLAPADSGGAET